MNKNFTKKILFVVSECRPFVASGGLADVTGSLPSQLIKQGLTVDVVMPLYQSIKRKFGKDLVKIETKDVYLDYRKQQTNLYSIDCSGVKYYFIDYDYYYDRPNLYGYDDDIERFTFFCTAVISFFQDKYDIFHCHDWQTALIPTLLKMTKPTKRTILTIHNIDYQGKFAVGQLQDLTGLSSNFLGIFEWQGSCNLLKSGIVMCDKLTTVSPSYADEIQLSYYSAGLCDIIMQNRYKLVGILNGIDTLNYSSSLDTNLVANFDASTLANKKLCKHQLQQTLGLPQNDLPLFCMVTRLATHKGLDLVKSVIPYFLQKNIQFAILGTGEKEYEEFFASLSKTNDNCACVIDFNNVLAKLIYGGADYLIMPSLSEPCGLSQMIACRYATLPIVRRVGGLGDSIINNKQGIVFDDYDTTSLSLAWQKGIDIYLTPIFDEMRRYALATDFSWEISSQEYIKLYKSI
ncbi:MAG: glycogen synthase [Clostridia bacterium]